MQFGKPSPKPSKGWWPEYIFSRYKFKQAVLWRNGDGDSMQARGPTVHLFKLQRGPRLSRTFICTLAWAQSPSIPSLGDKSGTSISILQCTDIEQELPWEGQARAWACTHWGQRHMSWNKELSRGASMQRPKPRYKFITENATSWAMYNTEEEFPMRWTKPKRQREGNTWVYLYESHVSCESPNPAK